MQIFQILGLYLIEASYLPQLWRLHKLKQAHEFSFLFPGLNILGRLFGVAYSLSKGDQVIGLFFIVGIVLRGTLLGQVLYYRARARRLGAQKM
jgi:PQ loop repeat protein